MLQKDEEIWSLVSYASRSLTDKEQRYSPLEIEVLKLTQACER